MDSKIIGLIAGSFLLTGCITGKVERLHSTTTQLSTDIDNYIAMSNRTLDIGEKADLELKHKILNKRLEDTEINQKGDELFKDDAEVINSFLVQLYMKNNYDKLIKKQNEYLSAYFKGLTNTLEKKDVGNNLDGLVKNIDILNQIIEKNLKIEDELKGRLKPNESSLIEATLSNGFKYYQYHQFRKGINRSYDVILEALVNQKLHVFANNQNIFLFLNQKNFSDRNSLVDSYKKQMEEAKSLTENERSKLVYKDEDLKKIIELSKQPYTLQQIDPAVQQLSPSTTYRSQAYKDICPSPIIDEINKTPNFPLKPYTAFDAKLDSKKSSKPYTFSFDIEELALKRGENTVCELIDIVGLMKEKKYTQVQSTSLKRAVENYNAILDFIDPQSQKKQEDK